MAELIADLFSTLDGFGTGPVGYWGKQGPELEAARERAFGAPDQVLLFGAGTYRLMERFHAGGTSAVSTAMTAARKVVVSRTLPEPLLWGGATLVRGDAVQVVPRLKAESKVPLRCHGSIRVNRALLAAGLVDRLELTLFPVSTGVSGSNPVLAGLPDLDLELLGSRTYDGQVQQLSYAVRGPWPH